MMENRHRRRPHNNNNVEVYYRNGKKEQNDGDGDSSKRSTSKKTVRSKKSNKETSTSSPSSNPTKMPITIMTRKPTLPPTSKPTTTKTNAPTMIIETPNPTTTTLEPTDGYASKKSATKKSMDSKKRATKTPTPYPSRKPTIMPIRTMKPTSSPSSNPTTTNTPSSVAPSMEQVITNAPTTIAPSVSSSPTTEEEDNMKIVHRYGLEYSVTSLALPISTDYAELSNATNQFIQDSSLEYNITSTRLVGGNFFYNQPIHVDYETIIVNTTTAAGVEDWDSIFSRLFSEDDEYVQYLRETTESPIFSTTTKVEYANASSSILLLQEREGIIATNSNHGMILGISIGCSVVFLFVAWIVWFQQRRGQDKHYLLSTRDGDEFDEDDDDDENNVVKQKSSSTFQSNNIIYLLEDTIPTNKKDRTIATF